MVQALLDWIFKKPKPKEEPPMQKELTEEQKQKADQLLAEMRGEQTAKPESEKEAPQVGDQEKASNAEKAPIGANSATLPRTPENIDVKPEQVQVLRPGKNLSEQETFILLERADEHQIMAEEIAGEVLDKFVYKVRKQLVLSYAGVREAARRYRNVEFGIDRVEEDETSVMVHAYAKNLADNVAVRIPKRHSKRMTLKSGRVVEDEFALEKCVSKALRNALKAVLPVSYLEVWIAKYQEMLQMKNSNKK